MAQLQKKGHRGRQAADDIINSLRELAHAVEEGAPLARRFTVRTVRIPEPGKYSPAAVKRLRHDLGMSQAVFAELLGVSRIWVQGWERGVRRPSLLACRLLDTIRANPASWLATVWAKAG
ncbi:MAG TPA: helix-turn-helix domain-containing protein [Tepidisphaeraceae bacterium]|nr:helix-turn-helix domain-containing protein [Tepidisphaeraceae bacterium]